MLVCGTLYRVCSVLHVGHAQCGLCSSRTSAQASVRCQRLLLTRTSCAAISCARQPKPRNAVYNALQHSVQRAATQYHCTAQRAATQYTVLQCSTTGCDVLHYSTTNTAASCARQAHVQTVWRSALLLAARSASALRTAQHVRRSKAGGGSWRGTAGAANVHGSTKAQGNKGTRLMGIRRVAMRTSVSVLFDV